MNVQEEMDRQDKVRREAATVCTAIARSRLIAVCCQAKQQLRQTELLEKVQIEQAKTQQVTEKREAALRVKEMERLAKERYLDSCFAH